MLSLTAACWPNTKDCFKMTNFETFYNELLEFISAHEKNHVLLKTEKDPNSDIVKIFGENMSALSRAKNGLTEISELSYTTAEHHPYWNLLYNLSEMTHTVLEKWDEKLTTKDISDIKWAIKEINQTIEKLEEKNNLTY